MSFTLGRFSADNVPTSLTLAGDSATLNFDILPSTLAEAKAMRQQITGLANNPDEPVVPFTWSDDSDYDGYYSIQSATVTPTQVYLLRRLMRVTVTMTRVGGGYNKPKIELPATCVLLTNDHSLTTTYGRVAHPQDGLEDYNAGIGFGEYAAGREVEVDGGYVRWSRVPSLPASGVPYYYVPPANYYIGAATLEVQRNSTWYPVHGRQVPALDTAGAWRLTNGLVRIYPSGTHNYRVDVFDGSWVELVTIQRGYDDTGWTAQNFGVNNPTGLSWTGESTVKVDPAILRNSPERVTIEIPQWGGYERLSLLRGAGWIEVTYGRPGETPGEKYGVGASTTIACTDNTNRATRTTADGNGNKFFLAIPDANTVDTTNGRIYLDSADSRLTFRVGVETPQFDSGTAEYLYAYTSNQITQRVVRR